MRQESRDLKDALHTRSPSMTNRYEDLRKSYNQNVKPAEDQASSNLGEMAKFLDKYLLQVEALLEIVYTCRIVSLEGYIDALADQIKYFFARALPNYSRMTPVHVAELAKLKQDDSDTWEALKAGDFVAVHSSVPFMGLFNDQSLEQEIKLLKKHGGVKDATQDEALLEKMLLIAPHLTILSRKFLSGFPRNRACKTGRTEHYQLKGEMGVRIFTNALKIKQRMEVHCQGNVYSNKMALKSIASSTWIPEEAKDDILNFDQKGLEAEKVFITERLLLTSPKSIWDPLKKPKIKSFSTWMPKTRISIGDTVIKVREERQLFGRMLVIQEYRPDLVPPLEETMKKYEMSVIARMFCGVDGSLYIPKDKSSLMKGVLNMNRGENIFDSDTDTGIGMLFSVNINPSVVSAEDLHGPTHDFSSSDVLSEESCMDLSESNHGHNQPYRIKIIDAMAVLRGMKKKPSTKLFKDLSREFIAKLDYLLQGFDEGRIIFDPYNEAYVLKQQTQKKRSSAIQTYDVYWEMPLNMSLSDLFSASASKRKASKLLGEAILRHYEKERINIVVAYENQVVSISSIVEHSHDEADQLIPNQVKECARIYPFADINVESPDTDVFMILMHLTAKGHLSVNNSLTLVSGQGKKNTHINIVERVCVVGPNKSKGLLGFHNFTGADWGGKFVGITKKTWTDAYLSLDDESDVVKAFCSLGEGIIPENITEYSIIPEVLKPLDQFVCQVYSQNGPYNIPDLRWYLFRSKLKEAESLPPSHGAFLPHILRSDYVTMRDKSYTVIKPTLPPMEKCGWMKQGDKYLAVQSFLLPAPKAVVEFIQCSCKVQCSGRCSCHKERLPCTPLCKCYDQCTNEFTRHDDIPSSGTNHVDDNDYESEDDEDN